MYRYVAGKADWFAAGWPREGRCGEAPYIGDLCRRDLPTCGPGERLGDVRRRVEAAGWDRCAVVAAGDVVIGLLSGPRLRADARLRADQAMALGPSTFRPSVPLAEIADYMRGHRLQSVLVTTSEGVLIGSLDRRTVEETMRA